jgi:hypothetical protein
VVDTHRFSGVFFVTTENSFYQRIIMLFVCIETSELEVPYLEV